MLKKEVDYLAGLVINKAINLREVLKEWHHSRPNYPLIGFSDLYKMLMAELPEYPRLQNIIESMVALILSHNPDMPKDNAWQIVRKLGWN